MQAWCALGHGILRVEHGGQHFVLHVDEGQCLLGVVGAGRGYRRHGVPLVEHLLPRHQVEHGEGPREWAGVREIRRCDHRLHAGVRLDATRVDAQDAREGMRAAQERDGEHTGALAKALV